MDFQKKNEEIKVKDFSIELMKEVFNNIFNNPQRPTREIDWSPKLCEWEEDGQIFYCWKIGTAYTNDAGKKIFDEALKKT